MPSCTLKRELTIPRPIDTVFQFFSRAQNLEALTPPWLRFRIATPPPIELRQGATIVYKLRVRGVPLRWLTEIEIWSPPAEFVDVQVKGPYKHWRHVHRFTAVVGGTRMVDIVDYRLPFGPIGRLVHRMQVAEDLATIFDYREQRIRELLG